MSELDTSWTLRVGTPDCDIRAGDTVWRVERKVVSKASAALSALCDAAAERDEPVVIPEPDYVVDCMLRALHRYPMAWFYSAKVLIDTVVALHKYNVDLSWSRGGSSACAFAGIRLNCSGAAACLARTPSGSLLSARRSSATTSLSKPSVSSCATRRSVTSRSTSRANASSMRHVALIDGIV